MNNFLEYSISLMIVGASFMVIVSYNPIFSVFWLVMAFVNAAIMFIALGLDYIGLILIIVYVGAIAILFLFVVMLVGHNPSEEAHLWGRAQIWERTHSEDYSHLLPVGLSLIFLFSGSGIIDPSMVPPVVEERLVSNISAIGGHLYTTYYHLVLIASLVLLVAMIGAILLARSESTILSHRIPYSQPTLIENPRRS
uniref:NADH dehydrogenase subunit 6 n=1 Tax=Leptophyton benayahui TaxID=767318 RepID=UPI001FAEF514|nr:NADH dehydrogenase subunit 6 [Leptophyton benayahui]UKP88403.1 NADH dehydrogenase subunit 6 [Leptophyton benayahui]